MPTPPVTAPSILIIEDQSMPCEDWTSLFGYDFIVEKNASKIAHLLYNYAHSIRLIVLDDLIYKPLDLLIKIREINDIIPIYIMTSSTTFKDQSLCFGATGFIKAPFDLESFQEVFRRHEYELQDCTHAY